MLWVLPADSVAKALSRESGAWETVTPEGGVDMKRKKPWGGHTGSYPGKKKHCVWEAGLEEDQDLLRPRESPCSSTAGVTPEWRGRPAGPCFSETRFPLKDFLPLLSDRVVSVLSGCRRHPANGRVGLGMIASGQPEACSALAAVSVQPLGQPAF